MKQHKIGLQDASVPPLNSRSTNKARLDLSAIFRSAPVVAATGIGAETIGDGCSASGLPLREQHLQHDGVVHGGVLAKTPDHAAGAAAASLLRPGEIVLTTEFKISLAALPATTQAAAKE